MTTTPRQSCIARAAELGVKLTTGGGRHFEVVADAPEGMVFVASGLHSQVSATCDDEPAAKAWSDALERMSGGIERCEDPDCEYCHPEA